MINEKNNVFNSEKLLEGMNPEEAKEFEGTMTEMTDLFKDLENMMKDPNISEGLKGAGGKQFATASVDGYFSSITGISEKKLKKKITNISLLSKVRDIETLATRNNFKLKAGRKVIAMTRKFIQEMGSKRDPDIRMLRYNFYFMLKQLYDSFLDLYNNKKDPVDSSEKSDALVVIGFKEFYNQLLEDLVPNGEDSVDMEKMMKDMLEQFNIDIPEEDVKKFNFDDIKMAKILYKEVSFDTIKKHELYIISKETEDEIFKRIKNGNYVIDEETKWTLTITPIKRKGISCGIVYNEKTEKDEPEKIDGFDLYLSAICTSKYSGDDNIVDLIKGKFQIEATIWNSIKCLKNTKFDEEFLVNYNVTEMLESVEEDEETA